MRDANQELIVEKIIQDCKNRNWDVLKKFIDGESGSPIVMDSRTRSIYMQAMVVASAFFETYHIDHEIKKKYGLNIWNHNLYWGLNIPSRLQLDAVNLTHFFMVYSYGHATEDEALRAQILSYVNQHKKILCSLLSDDKTPLNLKKMLMTEFDGFVTAEPQLTSSEKQTYLNEMISLTDKEYDDKGNRNYISANRLFESQQHTWLYERPWLANEIDPSINDGNDEKNKENFTPGMKTF